MSGGDAHAPPVSVSTHDVVDVCETKVEFTWDFVHESLENLRTLRRSKDMKENLNNQNDVVIAVFFTSYECTRIW